MKEIYVVYGTTGEWSDRMSWPVRAFVTKTACEQFMRDLLALLLEIGIQRGGERAHGFPFYYQEQIDTDEEFAPIRVPWRKLLELDPGIQVTYTGNDYHYDKVGLVE